MPRSPRYLRSASRRPAGERGLVDDVLAVLDDEPAADRDAHGHKEITRETVEDGRCATEGGPYEIHGDDPGQAARGSGGGEEAPRRCDARDEGRGEAGG